MAGLAETPKAPRVSTARAPISSRRDETIFTTPRIGVALPRRNGSPASFTAPASCRPGAGRGRRAGFGRPDPVPAA
jgi:hypothetical protein